MNSYLQALLAELHTLIIPGLGALTVTNAERGEILFMPYLKYDDGKLAQHIADKEGMTLNEAKNLVAKYVREIEQQLHRGDRYDLYQFGSFSKDSSGEIQFTTWDKLFSSPQIEATSDDDITLPEHETDLNIINEKEIISNEPPEEKLPADLFEPITLQESDTDLSQTDTSNESIQDDVINYSVEEQWNDDLDVPPVGYNKPLKKQPILEKTKKDGTKRSKTLPLLLFSALILACIGGILFFKSTQQKRPSLAEHKGIVHKARSKKQLEQRKYKKVDDLNATQKEPIGVDTLKPAEATTPIVADQPNIDAADKANYHIIGNAFKNKSNAERYCKKLIETGKPAEIVCKLGGLYHVKINSFEHKSEAQHELNSYKAISKGAWIMFLKR